MNVRYTEGPDEVTIAAAGVKAKRGEAVEVPKEIGEALVEQGWETVKSSTAKKKETN